MSTKSFASQRALAVDDDDHGLVGQLRRHGKWIALAVLVLVLAAMWLPRGRSYPEVTSRESLTLVKALYTACNTRNEAWLNQVEQQVAQAFQEGKMSSREQQAFERIIATARAGEWEAAQQASLQFAEDQVRR